MRRSRNKLLHRRWARTPLEVQWLGPSAFTAGALASIPGSRTTILQAVRHSQVKNKQEIPGKARFVSCLCSCHQPSPLSCGALTLCHLRRLCPEGPGEVTSEIYGGATCGPMASTPHCLHLVSLWLCLGSNVPPSTMSPG